MQFLTAVAGALGEAAVLSADEVARASASLADWGRTMPGVIRVSSVEQVRTVLRLATEHGARVAPWSRGLNWGYGTRLPPRDGTFGLDLSAMARIRAHSARTGTLTVEPGVTQAQATSWLEAADTGYYLDVTGAAPETSVLGNTLERGIAYNSLRADALRHLEVVLADGRVLRTGYGWLDAPEVADVYRHGIGPNLTELFVQSNLGVVTAGTVGLRPVPERRIPLQMPLEREADLPAFLEALAREKERLKLDAIFHVGNLERTMTTLAPMIREAGQRRGVTLDRADVERLVRRVVPAGWAGLGQIEGTSAFCAHAFRALRAALKPFCRVRAIESSRLTRSAWAARMLGLRDLALVADASLELSGLTAGRPTLGPMRGVYWPFFDDEPAFEHPEHGRSGWLLCAPLFPPWDGHVERVLAVIREEAERAVVRLGVTVNLLSPHLAQAIVSFSWRRDEAGATSRAHAAQARATERLLDLGYPPYRAALGEMDMLTRKSPVFFEVAARLKKALDPHGVLAPGRYIPANEAPA